MCYFTSDRWFVSSLRVEMLMTIIDDHRNVGRWLVVKTNPLGRAMNHHELREDNDRKYIYKFYDLCPSVRIK